MSNKGVNKVILVATLGSDPEIRFTGDGKPVANFTVATNETFKNSAGEPEERTEWHRITIFGKLADICKQYLKKGSKVYLEGSNRTRSWEKDGHKMYTTEVICNVMQMLSDKGNSNE